MQEKILWFQGGNEHEKLRDIKEAGTEKAAVIIKEICPLKKKIATLT